MLQSLKHHQSHENGTLKIDVKRDVSTSRLPRRRSSGLKFFASSAPSTEVASNSQKKWEADYLKDLREHRPARPGGSRPLPDVQTRISRIPENRAASALSNRLPAVAKDLDGTAGLHERSASALSHRRAQSDLPSSFIPFTPGEQPRSQNSQTTDPSQSPTDQSPTSGAIVGGRYRESGLRWMEKQEAKSLRAALEDMDSMREAKIQAAAQKEASVLVHQHQNGEMRAQRPNRLRSYREHLEKGAHARSLSQALDEEQLMTSYARRQNQNVGSNNPANGASEDLPRTAVSEDDVLSRNISEARETSIEKPQGHLLWDSPERRAYMNMTFPMPLRKNSGRRKSSGPRARDSSGGLFRNPEDKIYEEPQESGQQITWADSNDNVTNAALTTKTRNTVYNVGGSTGPRTISNVSSSETKPYFHRSEIHRNPPSQSNNPSYTKNEVHQAVPSQHVELAETGPAKATPPTSSLEIRSDEIRAATSRKLRDRSPRLPSPTVVSERPGRPIVSFDTSPVSAAHKISQKDGLPAEEETVNPRRTGAVLASTESAPVVPTISVSDVPSIQIEGASDPVRNSESQRLQGPGIPDIRLSHTSTEPRPLPKPSDQSRPSPANRPLPKHSSTAPVRDVNTHWSAPTSRATTQCANCGLPIAGRIVSAAGQRFHPHCFTCYHCAEALECVAFFPEPEDKREERLARIQARVNGNCVPEEKPGQTTEDDGDESLRFYCHLDFHELFSPRCKSCKTPIESEAIVACGSTWHVGHFFCAECGDPFDAKTPFVEKNGYAWCVKCHAGRFSGKCKGCRKPVIKEGISALGSEWHEACFVCVECKGGFEDGRFFTRDEDQSPVCVKCEERRLKA